MKRLALIITLLAATSVQAAAEHSNPIHALPPLHQAVIKGDLNKVKALVEAGADVNRLDGLMGNAPLHIAAQTDHTEILTYQVDHGAFINLMTPRSGQSPLMVAAWYSKGDNIDALFGYPELNLDLTNYRGVSAQQMVGGWDRHIEPHEAKLYGELRARFERKRAQQQQLLAEQKILNTIENKALSLSRKLAIIEELLQQGQDVNQRRPVYSGANDWHTPLLVAAREGYTDIVKLLLKHGADQTIPGYPMNAIAFHKAGYMGHPEIVQLLLADSKAPLVLNAQGPNNGYTPLHDAIWHGSVEAAKAFIDGGANLELETYEGDTPKQLAERYDYRQITELLSR